MENKKPPVFVMWIIVIIVGVALYKQFDFDNMTFQKPALAAVYGITFLFAAFVLIKNAIKPTKKEN